MKDKKNYLIISIINFDLGVVFISLGILFNTISEVAFSFNNLILKDNFVAEFSKLGATFIVLGFFFMTIPILILLIDKQVRNERKKQEKGEKLD